MSSKEIIELLESSWFGIRRQKVFVNGRDKFKYKYLEIIEIFSTDKIALDELQAYIGGKIKIVVRHGKEYWKLQITGTSAAEICRKYEKLLDKKQKRANIIIKLADDKLNRIYAPQQKQEFRESLFQEIKTV